ncbi:2-carboxy-1,4-naphthoquinone phytyltransferase [filamentous cyanobacterium CCP5]|nr:2-carboxy-1,4-naphthoquinone phytyltransferase [filamentous cyanobacterium CCP5]
MTIRSIQPDQQQLWLAAIKPPMYSVAAMPILVGSAVAYYETRQFSWLICLVFVLSAVLILAWENLSNDVFDSETGIDVNKPHSLVNLTRNKSLIFAIGNLCLLMGISGILAIAWWQRDPTVLGIILICCLLGYCYQGPPFRLGYRGLGEPLCFLSFGPLGVGAAYYSQTATWSLTSQLAGVVVGITTTLVLFCSHFHQVEEDLAAGKRSPIVRLGTGLGSWLVPCFCAIALFTIAAAIGSGIFPLGTLIALGSIITAVRLSRHVKQFHAIPERISNAKFFAIGFHFWSGLLLTIGFTLA